MRQILNKYTFCIKFSKVFLITLLTILGIVSCLFFCNKSVNAQTQEATASSQIELPSVLSNEYTQVLDDPLTLSPPLVQLPSYLGINSEINNLQDGEFGFIKHMPYLGESLTVAGFNLFAETKLIPAVIQNVSDNPNYLFTYKTDLVNGVSAHFLEKARNRAGFAIASDQYQYKLKFFLDGETIDHSVKDNNLSFKVLTSDTTATLDYKVSTNEIKEDIILSNKPTDNKISFTVDSKDMALVQNGQEYSIQSPDGSVTWTIMKPTVVDAEGKNGEISAEFVDGKYILTLDDSFAQNAIYPITIDPTVLITSSSNLNPTLSHRRKGLVRTSDGTLHAFVQMGALTATCAGSSKSGILWWYSTDNGATWTCGAQVSTATGSFSTAGVDSSDNIYVMASADATAAGVGNNVIYNKLTKGSGATWTVGTAQTLLTSTSTNAYYSISMALEGDTRIWAP
ncbi:exo-alpha-sialidase, partial [Candidatus Microgenomates bacterium]|nr:exo-alpha-sialidase [Candidatus Microgenomates bacterium]